jgi:preprotein translocase subunit SecG
MNRGLYFVVGALVVAVVVIGYVLLGPGGGDSTKDVDIKIEAPAKE